MNWKSAIMMKPVDYSVRSRRSSRHSAVHCVLCSRVCNIHFARFDSSVCFIILNNYYKYLIYKRVNSAKQLIIVSLVVGH